MKNRIIWLMLAVVACFTISFAIGYVRAGRDRWHPPTLEEEVNFLAARAGLNEEQKQAFLRYRSAVRAKKRELRKANAEVFEAYWAEVMKAQPDPVKIEQFTDHGAATPMYVIGDKVKGGLYGAYPSLEKLDDNGDLVMTTDFRRVYATVIKEWMGHQDTKTILKGDFAPLGIFNI